MIKLESQNTDNGLHILCAGRLTLMELPSLETAAKEWYATSFQDLVLDFSGLEEIDSSGIGALIAIKFNCLKLNRKLTIVAGEKVQAKFRALKVHSKFAFSPK